MNAGKLIAQIAVLAIVVYCCYGAIIQAIPLGISSTEDAFQVDNMTVNTETDGLELTVDFKGSITSGLPQDVDDVTATISIGDEEERLNLASVDVGSLKAKSTTDIATTQTIPTYAVLAYGVDVDDSGTLTVPLVLEFTFKYMKWQGSYLIDLGVGVKQDLKMVTGATKPVVTVDPADNSANISMSLDSSAADNPLLNAIIDQLNNLDKKNYELACGDAKVVFETKTDGTKANLSMKFVGNSTMNAADLMRSSLDENGSLILTFEGNEYSLEKENAETFISLVDRIYSYPEASA